MMERQESALRNNPPVPSADEVLQEVTRLLSDAPRWIVLSHGNPDGDTLGTASAFVVIGKKMGKSVIWGGPSHIPQMYRFLEGADDYVPELLLSSLPVRMDDVVIVLDTSTRARSVEDLSLVPQGVPVVNIDHHEDNERFGSVNWIDTAASATGELGWLLFRSWGTPLPLNAAEGLYIAISTDSGNFSFSSTTARTHEAAAALLASGVAPEKMNALVRDTRTLGGVHLRGRALGRTIRKGSSVAISWLEQKDFLETGSEPSETENLVNELLTIQGVLFAVLFTENPDNVRVSMRSKGSVSAAQIARACGGGGHPQAAGCRLPLPLELAMKKVEELLEQAYDVRSASR